MYVWHKAWCSSNLNWMQSNSDDVWGRLDVLFILPSASLKRTVNKEAVSIGQRSYEWMRNSTEFLIQSKQDYIYLFEIGFNTEIHPSSCAFPQLSGQILERAIEGRKGPLSTLQMGYFLLIPRETSHSHNLARNSISPGVSFSPSWLYRWSNTTGSAIFLGSREYADIFQLWKKRNSVPFKARNIWTCLLELLLR